MKSRILKFLPGVLLAAMVPGTGWATDAFANVTVSGFASLYGGKTFGPCAPTKFAKNSNACTAFVADYGYGQMYTPSFSLTQESRAGLQITNKFSEDVSATMLLETRPQAGEALNLNWAYVTYRPTPDWTVQVGRKRLPLFQYYDSMDVGYSSNLIRPNAALYGWAVTNYNGASADYEFALAGWTLRAQAFAGQESTKKNRYMSLYYPTPQNVDWKNIEGATLDFSKEWFSGRIGYTKLNFSQTDSQTGPIQQLTGTYSSEQNFLDVALNADLGNWTLKSELAKSDQRGFGPVVTSWMMSAGYRTGKLTTSLEYARYDERTPWDPSVYTPVQTRSYVLAERYDLRDGMALKIQLDHFLTLSGAPGSPLVNVVTVGFDSVF